MTYSDYSLTPAEYKIFQETGKSAKLEQIWEDLLRRIPDPNAVAEAREKRYELVDNPDIEDDVIAFYKMLIVPNTSDNLKRIWEEDLYPFVVCLKD